MRVLGMEYNELNLTIVSDPKLDEAFLVATKLTNGQFIMEYRRELARLTNEIPTLKNINPQFFSEKIISGIKDTALLRAVNYKIDLNDLES